MVTTGRATNLTCREILLFVGKERVFLSVASVLLVASLVALSTVPFLRSLGEDSLALYSVVYAAGGLLLALFIASTKASLRGLLVFLVKYHRLREEDRFLDDTNTVLFFGFLMVFLAPLAYSFFGPAYSMIMLFTGGTLIAMAVSGYVVRYYGEE